MKLLLDSCTFLWLIWDQPELSARARVAIADPGNEVYLSSVSLWEILIKHGTGKVAIHRPIDPQRFYVEQRELHGIAALALGENAIVQLTKLPELHRDPFDRALICQAIAHGLTLVTPDAQINRYPVLTLW